MIGDLARPITEQKPPPKADLILKTTFTINVRPTVVICLAAAWFVTRLLD